MVTATYFCSNYFFTIGGNMQSVLFGGGNSSKLYNVRYNGSQWQFRTVADVISSNDSWTSIATMSADNETDGISFDQIIQPQLQASDASIESVTISQTHLQFFQALGIDDEDLPNKRDSISFENGSKLHTPSTASDLLVLLLYRGSIANASGFTGAGSYYLRGCIGMLKSSSLNYTVQGGEFVKLTPSIPLTKVSKNLVIPATALPMVEGCEASSSLTIVSKRNTSIEFITYAEV